MIYPADYRHPIGNIRCSRVNIIFTFSPLFFICPTLSRINRSELEHFFGDFVRLLSTVKHEPSAVDQDKLPIANLLLATVKASKDVPTNTLMHNITKREKRIPMTLVNEALRENSALRKVVWELWGVPANVPLPALSTDVLYGDLSITSHSRPSVVFMADKAPADYKALFVGWRSNLDYFSIEAAIQRKELVEGSSSVQRSGECSRGGLSVRSGRS